MLHSLKYLHFSLCLRLYFLVFGHQKLHLSWLDWRCEIFFMYIIKYELSVVFIIQSYYKVKRFYCTFTYNVNCVCWTVLTMRQKNKSFIWKLTLHQIILYCKLFFPFETYKEETPGCRTVNCNIFCSRWGSSMPHEPSLLSPQKNSMNSRGLDTRIPNNGLKLYPEILQKMSINPSFISTNLDLSWQFFVIRNIHIICIKCEILLTCCQSTCKHLNSNWLKMAIYFNVASGTSIANIFLFQTNDNDNKNLCYRLYFSKLCRLKILKFCYQLYDWL